MRSGLDASDVGFWVSWERGEEWGGSCGISMHERESGRFSVESEIKTSRERWEESYVEEVNYRN